jgi:hypothetical protein
MNIESITSIKEFPFMQLSIVYQLLNSYFAPLNTILHSLLQIDLLVNYFFTPEIKQLFEPEEEISKNNPINKEKEYILTQNFRNLIYNYWCPNDESLVLETSNIINKFTLLSLAKNEIEKKDMNKMPQKIITTFVRILHEELNKLKKNNENNNEKKNEIVNPFDRCSMLNNFIIDFKNNYYSIISDHFFGVYENIYECIKCKELENNGIIHSQKMFKYEIFDHLEFNIEEIALYKIKKTQNCSLKAININDCIESINLPLNNNSNSDENLIYCKNCNMKVNSVKYKEILSLPRILIITLDYGKMSVKNNKFSLKYNEKMEIQNNSFLLISVFGELKEKYYLANLNPIDYKWYLYDNFKYIDNIQKEIINNQLFKPLFLIYKLSKEKLATNNNPIIFYNNMNDQIDIYFNCMLSKTKYKLNVSLKWQFIKVIHKLFNAYPELENKNFATFLCDAKKINVFDTVFENNLSNNSMILMI